MKIYRNEHPNPQFMRSHWQNLNGEWDFGFKKVPVGFKFSQDEARALKYHRDGQYPYTINVPFCIESELSGIGNTDFVNLVWYKKVLDIKKSDERIFLYIGAADYLTTVLINGKSAGRHKGGYTSFSFDITELIVDGENEIFILCEDNVKDPLVCRGKQSEQKKSHGCDYTRTTGIWQTVYLEFTPQKYIKDFKIYPDAHNCSVTLDSDFIGTADFECNVFYNGQTVGSVKSKKISGNRRLNIPLSEKHLWETGNGRLYDLEMKFGDDTVKSYFGLRDIRLDGFKFLINEKSVFQRLVLDQGFYKDGIYTAKDESEFIKDIELSLALGFNGARLHQKVFEPRFLYHCDKMGYLVWGEYANWGLDYSSDAALAAFLTEWAEAVNRDFNHPSIIGWCPFNETWDYRGRQQKNELLSVVYDYTKAVDKTRPCIDTSGNFHVKTDIYDVHDYNYDPVLFKKNFDKLLTDDVLYEHVLIDNPNRQKYGGQPVFVSEYGGIKWQSDKSVKSWGYGENVKTPEEFAQRYCGLTDALISNEKMFGFCYTQLYDIEQEQNGLYTYNRVKKFADSIYSEIIKVNTKIANIEK
ncbi:MAG: beta-galactosidase [Eubacterium sp.]|nr:beta-galactosidase [Eubacterium sp.]MDE6154926.1 beta-galactosidase [Eubacterium sp.]MDE6766732.1 beta-galactosidase [Eubacterium sp.]